MKSVVNDVTPDNYFMIPLAHRGLNKMDNILQMSRAITFSYLKMMEY